VLLGNARSNPWIEPFLPRLGVRWMFDKAQGVYYPVDTLAAGEAKVIAPPTATRARVTAGSRCCPTWAATVRC
jgi:hypothetical protein